MKKKILTLALFIGSLTFAFSQNTDTSANPDATLHPNAHTKYFDEKGNEINQVQFMKAMSEGGYTFKPTVNGKEIEKLSLLRADNKITPGMTAPDFSVTDIQGKTYKLSELKGKIVVLNFWFTACAGCIQEMPDLNKLATKYKNNRNVVFLAITYNTEQEVKKFLSKKTFLYNIAAGRAELIKTLGINVYPTSLVIDAQGNIAYVINSFTPNNGAQLDGVITALGNKS